MVVLSAALRDVESVAWLRQWLPGPCLGLSVDSVTLTELSWDQSGSVWDTPCGKMGMQAV